MVQEFRDFIAKGNMIDIAVGFIMGAAFTRGDRCAGRQRAHADRCDSVRRAKLRFSIIWTINGSEILIGSFITAIVAFLLVALAVFFFIVKPYNAYRDSTGSDEEEDAGPDRGRAPDPDPGFAREPELTPTAHDTRRGVRHIGEPPFFMYRDAGRHHQGAPRDVRLCREDPPRRPHDRDPRDRGAARRALPHLPRRQRPRPLLPPEEHAGRRRPLRTGEHARVHALRRDRRTRRRPEPLHRGRQVAAHRRGR